MAVKVGINGFGRIGRLSLRAMLERYPNDIDIVGINDLTSTASNAYLFKYDSVYGVYPGEVSHTENSLKVGKDEFKVFAERDPANIPWGDLGADIVIESTGLFTDATKAAAHLKSGAKKVIISAPAKNEDVTIVLGVNDEAYNPSQHHVISNASCTTNGLAPVAKVLHETHGIEKGLLTTIHAYTNSQATVDTAKKGNRDSRAASENVVPASTGAAKAVGLVIPELVGKFTGMAFRVPVPTVSVVDFTAVLSQKATADEINAAMKRYADGPMSGVLEYTDEELVSSDLKGNAHSSIFSSTDTVVLDDMIKVVAWYDNEWGYSCRIADLVKFVADKGI